MECDKGGPIVPIPPSGDAVDLAEEVLHDWIAHVANGTGIDVVNHQIQVQFANGSGYTGYYQLKPITPMPIDGTSHLVATRAGRLLVLSYNATTPLDRRGRPHLTVFLEDGGPLAGNWSMISQSNFNSPKLPPTAPACAGQNAGLRVLPSAINLLSAAYATMLLVCLHLQ